MQINPNEVVIEKGFENYKLSIYSDFKMQVSEDCMLKITKITKSNIRINIQIHESIYQV